MKPKTRKQQPPESVLRMGYDPEQLRERLIAISDYANDQVLNREDEIRLILSALLTKMHVFLLGPPGVAKSLLAETMFAPFVTADEEARYFKVQFRRGTSEDEVLGVLSADEYKKNARWVLNTEGALPEAHFAFLDEILHASDHLRAAVFGILNERQFSNGTRTMKCPLMTAVATANALPSEASDAAFNDRWLFLRTVKSTVASDDRLAVIRSHLRRLEGKTADTAMPTGLNIAELRFIQRYIAKTVPLTEDELVAFEQLRMAFVNGSADKTAIYISDRRSCWSVHVLKAMKFITASSFEDAAYAAMRCFNTTGEPKLDAALDAAYESTIAVMASRRREQARINEHNKLVSRLSSLYDPDLPAPKLAKLRSHVVEAMELLNAEGEFDTPEFKSAHSTQLNSLHSILASIPEPADTTLNELQNVADQAMGALEKAEGGDEEDPDQDPDLPVKPTAKSPDSIDNTLASLFNSASKPSKARAFRTIRR